MPDTSHLAPDEGERKEAMSASDLDPVKVYKLTVSEARLAKVRPYDRRHDDDVPEDELEEKCILDFDESEKCLFLNKTNLKTMWSICQSKNSDDFAGAEVELSVRRYGNGKDGIVVGAVREADDDIPF